jgi:AraC-like DNA-binding protein
MANRETRLIRSATLRGYAEAAAAVGLDPKAMLSRVGFEPELLNQTDRIISFDAFLELLALSAASSGCADFGVRAAISRGIPDLGAVSLLMREAETLEAALQLYTSHLTLHSDGTFIQLDKRFESPVILIEIRGRTREQSIQGTQFCVTGVIMQIRYLIGDDFKPELVCFSQPKVEHTRVTSQFCGCPVSYNQILSGIVINRTTLTRPLVTSPPFLRKLALQHLEPILQQPADSFAARVSRIVRQTLEDGDCSAEAVSKYFGVDRRTLNRRLNREGETFSSVLQKARIEAIRRVIDLEDRSLTELADTTGFQSLSSFSRWFHTTFGCTASEWRKQGTFDRVLPRGESIAADLRG